MKEAYENERMLDYAAGTTRYPAILAWTSLLFGSIGAFLPWYGPFLHLFNWVPVAHENLAYVVAFGPTILSLALGAAALCNPRKGARAIDLAAAAGGIILSVLGYLIYACVADMNWPYAFP
jgi:hypothetical protein